MARRGCGISTSRNLQILNRTLGRPAIRQLDSGRTPSGAGNRDPGKGGSDYHHVRNGDAQCAYSGFQQARLGAGEQ